MTFPSPRITVLLVAAIATVVAAVASHGPPTSAQGDPIVSVDAISDASNTATTVGPIDTCLSTTNGATFDVDVVIEDVTNISGFQANLLYNLNVLKVTAVNYNFLLASTVASVLDLGNSTPDTDGDFFMAAAMFSPVTVIGADGDGVLARITFEAVDSGISALDLTDVKLSDADGNPIPPTDANNFYTGSINGAFVTVDSSCADGDGDTVPDTSDNCPNDTNSGQENTDADLGTAGATMDGATIGDGDGDACDADDDDDEYTESDESAIGTVGDDNCAGSPGPGGDAWPPDFDLDQVINITDVFNVLPPVYGSSTGDPEYSERADLAPDGVINITDVFKVLPPIYGSSCT